MRIGPQTPIARLRSPAKSAETGTPVRNEKREAIEAMLDRGRTLELEGATPAQREMLHANLGKVDRGVLLWAKQQGVRLQVLQSGEKLEEAEALRDMSGRFEQRLKPDTVEKVHQHLEPLTEKIRAEQDPEKASALRRRKRNQMAEILTANPSGAAVYTPMFAPLLAPGLSSLVADPTETPTLKGIALHQGADSPEEQQKFYRWMETLNGDRLEEARQASIRERSELLKSRPDALNRWLERAKRRPETVPLDTTLFTLVVPDAHYLPSIRENETLLIDRSDVRSVEGWRNGDFRGQWFFLEDKANLLIRDSAVPLDTPIHELGHVVDMNLEKTAPEFYQSLKPQIERGYYRARQGGDPISRYSMANPREYVAEGFVAYYTRPSELRQKDAELFRIIDKMVEFCCKEAGSDRKLDRNMQRMWRDANMTA